MDFPDHDDNRAQPEEPMRPVWLFDETESFDEFAMTPLDEPVTSMAPDEVPPPPPPPSNRRAALAGALAGAVVAAAVSLGVVAITDDDEPARRAFSSAPIGNGQQSDIGQVLAAVQDAVVAINVQQPGLGGGLARGAGSGMVIDVDGLVLTNNHVVEDATSISVTLADGRDVDADLVGGNRSNDVALIQVRDVEELETVTFGSSSEMRVGDPVVAIGNALGLGGTPSVTTGIVSALGRELTAENGIELNDLIQTDAAIYPGNSGGPLVNAAGEVIGMNTAIARGPEGVGTENLGFAIPIEQLEPLIDELKEGGGEVRGGAFLGVRTADVEDVQPAIRERLGIQTESGALVTEVVPGSGADEAGLEAGDVIVAIDGQEVTSAAEVGQIVAKLEPGGSVEITIEREGEERTLTATLGSRGVQQ